MVENKLVMGVGSDVGGHEPGPAAPRRCPWGILGRAEPGGEMGTVGFQPRGI